MRIDEIDTRLAEIRSMNLDEVNGGQLTALEKEVADLQAERQKIMDEAQTRQQLRDKVAAGIVTGKTIEENEEENNMENRTYTIDSAEYREAYLLNLQGRELNAEQRAAVNGAAAIPTQTLNQIFRYLEESPILSRIDMTYIPGNVVLPVESAVAEASWVAMATAATDSSDAVTSISLGAHKLIKTLEINADVEAMAINAFEAWLVAKLGEKMEKALDNAVFNGTGSNQPTGILKTIATATGTFTKAKAKYSDLIAIIAALPSGPAKRAVFAMPRKLFFTDVIGIEDQAGQPVCHADVESPAKYNILGYHVILDDNIPADNILFGDFNAYKMNIAKAPTISSDDSVGFRTGTRVYRGLALADGKLALADAFVRYTRAAS
jgi:HK97 family phage major capsid protein